ncbi:MAG: VWA domain-containing protein, partial [Planctomycetia bacterium]|nr:VWA domain-containing protein [Planctomycetia bacterium]
MIAFPPGALPLAIAGVAAAAAPIAIHLFNRARFREIDWAAMDFLLEAASRSRSLLRFRDLWLLVLRSAAVVLFGLAVARPFLRVGAGAGPTGGPVHPILVIDNSMSMGRTRLGGRTLLDDAKDRAKACLADLPAGSRATVIPLCGPEGGYSLDPLRTQEDAAEAVEGIRCVDRAGTVVQAVDLAAQAAERGVDLADKRIVFIGDQQIAAWPADAKALLASGGGRSDRPHLELQAVAVAVSETDNTWVESFTLDEGVADVELPATLTAVIRHEGSQPRRHVQVSLVVDAAEVATETIDLEPGQAREVTFSHLFDAVAEPGRPCFVAATVSLPADDVPEDDRRCLVVPVVAALPVVFVDQYGAAGEDPRRGRFGETRSVRRLLAPVTSRDASQRHLVKVRHVAVGKLD